MKDGYRHYEYGFNSGYKIARKILSIKTDLDLDIKSHITELNKLKSTFVGIVNYCSSVSTTRIDNFMDIVDNRTDTLNLIASKRFIDDLNVAYGIFDTISDNLSKYEIGDYSIISNPQKFSINKDGKWYEFTYEESDNENTLEIIVDDIKEVKDNIRAFPLYFNDQVNNTIAHLETRVYDAMYLLGSKNNLKLIPSNIEILANSNLVSKAYADLYKYMDKQYRYIITCLEIIEEKSNFIISDIEDMVSQYKKYASNIYEEFSIDEEDETDDDNKEVINNKIDEIINHNPVPKKETFLEKYDRLKNSKKSIRISNRKYNISRIINRAIAQLGHDK